MSITLNKKLILMLGAMGKHSPQRENGHVTKYKVMGPVFGSAI